jgi:hypothetical protein
VSEGSLGSLDEFPDRSATPVRYRDGEREVLRAGESEAMAERQADARWMRSAKEVRAIALARLKEALAAYDASSAAPHPLARDEPADGTRGSGG